MFNTERPRNRGWNRKPVDTRSRAEKKRDEAIKKRRQLTGKIFETKGKSCYIILPEDPETPANHLPAIQLGDYTNMRPKPVYVPYNTDRLVSEANMGPILSKYGIEISKIRHKIQENIQKTPFPLHIRNN